MAKNPFEKLLAKYNYNFPANLIAQAPATPREAARLLVYDRKTKKISHDVFKNLTKHLPKNSVLVFNQTKVIPARLTVTKPTGGQARLLYISHDDTCIKVLADRKLTVGTRVTLGKVTRVTLVTEKKEGQFYFLKPNFSIKNIYKVLEKHGQTPLPPYIKHSPLSGKKLQNEYQTVFAKTLGSVAAPTASLHFTKSLMAKLKKAGIDTAFVTLHVGLGTFAPLTENQAKTGKLHSEYYNIDKKVAKLLNKAKKNGKPIISVGTTVTRTLESACDHNNQLTKLSRATELFIHPPYKFKFIDGMITNFHVPRSSLMMLVASLVGRTKLLEIYKLSIKKRYRLFSFGDGMLIK
jgi:S-adenosylmethionine:tRNA ribosyltransferase-isomerase